MAILDKSASAEGASIRNFGMLWVVGQANVELEAMARRSFELWQEAADDLGFWIRQVGSLHLAYEPLETQVLREFVEATEGRLGRRILVPAEARDRCPHIRGENLKAALYSPTEGAVDPREVVHGAAKTLSQRGVDVRFDTPVAHIERGRLLLANETCVEAEQIVVCPGPDLYSLYPNAYRQAGLIECRLQMLRLRPKANVGPLGIHLCAGLTLGHYANFRSCPSLGALKALHESKWPLQVASGIHVLVAEHPDGTITVGDSHAYGRTGPIYREDSIDEAILAALDEFLPTENYEIAQRWLGAYNTHPSTPFWSEPISEGIWALNLFGTGMTLSFAVTERLARHLGAS